MKKKTKEEIEELLNHEYTILGEYENTRTPVLVKHNKCGYTWQCRIDTLIRKNKPVRCPRCFQKRWDSERFLEFLKTLNITPLTEFEGIQKQMKFKCNICGRVWATKPLNIIYNGTRCPSCSAPKPLSNEEFQKRLQERYNEEYIALTDYVNSETKIKVKHVPCGTEFETLPASILKGRENHGSACPECSDSNFSVRKTLEEFKEDVRKLVGNEYEVIGEYLGNKVPIKMKHKKCGKEFEVRPDNFLFVGTRCPFCNLGSKAQDAIFNFIENIFPNAERNYKLSNKKEIDIYISDLKIGIEFDGLYWHSEDNVGKKYALEKTLQAEKEGIRLIHIFEDEWEEHPEIVKSKLMSILKQTTGLKKIYARKCIIREITTKEKNDFLNTNHIQGQDNSMIKLGLFYGDELVSVMTFCQSRLGIGHFSKDKTIYELSRFANKIEYNVFGSFGKLLKYFSENYVFSKIISYADLRWSSRLSNIYLKNGFTEAIINTPNYWYFYGKKRFHRFAFRKSMIKNRFPEVYDKSLTEFQMMDKTKYKRIWDCGTIRYEIKKEDILS